MAALAYLSVRMLAIFLVVEGLLDLGQVALMWPMVGPDGERIMSASMLAMPLVPPIAGVVMWFAAKPLALVAQLPGSSSASDVAVGADEWTRLVIVLFGLYLVATATPSLVAVAIRTFAQSSALPDTSITALMFRDSSASYEIAHSGTRVALGFLLIIGRGGMFTFVRFVAAGGSRSKGSSNQVVQSDGQNPGRR